MTNTNTFIGAGAGSRAQFQLNAGVHTTQHMVLGDGSNGSSRSEGYYNLYMGELHAGSLDAGYNGGKGSVYQYPGTSSEIDSLDLGSDSFSEGSYDLLGGSLESSGYQFVGHDGTGIMTQAAGTSNSIFERFLAAVPDAEPQAGDEPPGN